MEGKQKELKMKVATRNMAKINVLKCEKKMDRERPNFQQADREGNPIWSVTVQEQQFNEEFNIMETQINVYKSLEDLKLGEQVVELKVSTMGEGSGNFVKVNTFYTIKRSLNEKASIKDIFSADNLIPPSKRAAVKNNAQTATAQ